MEFPRLVYKSAHSHLLVEDQAQFDAAIAEGWFETVPEALAGKPVQKVVETTADAPPTREELEQKANDLDIKFDGRTPDKRLAEAIAAKLAEA